MSDESALTIGTMSPLKLLQPLGSSPGFCWPPWWIRRTIARTPCFFRIAAYLLAVAASSRNCRPTTPVGVTIRGVPFSVSPMKPTLTPPIVRTTVAGKSGAGFGFAFSLILNAPRHVSFFLFTFFTHKILCAFTFAFCFALYLATAVRSALVGFLSTLAERYWNLAPVKVPPLHLFAASG